MIRDHRYLVNCYVADENKPEYNNNIFLLYEFCKEKWYPDFERYLCNTENFVDMYETDFKHTMFIYKVSEKNQYNYNCFIKGEYSKFTEEYKRTILSYYKIGSGSAIYNVLYKKEDKFQELEKTYNIVIPRDQENSSKPYMYTPDGFRNGEIPIECYRNWMKTTKTNIIEPNIDFLEEIENGGDS